MCGMIPEGHPELPWPGAGSWLPTLLVDRSSCCGQVPGSWGVDTGQSHLPLWEPSPRAGAWAATSVPLRPSLMGSEGGSPI